MLYKVVLFIITFSFSGIVHEIYAQAQHISTDSNNNRTVIFDRYGEIDESIEQTGQSNRLLIMTEPDNDTSGKFTGMQEGYLNRLFAFMGSSATPLHAEINQKGERNHIFIMQNVKSEDPDAVPDSLTEKENRVNIKQKGNNNQATIIQN